MSDLYPTRPTADLTIEAEDPEMEQLAYEITAALEASSIAGVSFLARRKEAGEALLKARKRCKPKKWISWLKRHNINRQTAFRAIKAYSECNTVLHLDDVIEVLSENGEEQEKLDSSDPLPDSGKQFCGRNCRVGIGPSDCKACAKLNEPSRSAPPPPTSSGASTGPTTRRPNNHRSGFRGNAPPPKPPREPITLEQVFEQGQVCLSQAKRAKGMSKKVRAIERGDIYRTGTGIREERIAELLLDTAMSLMRVAFPVACLTCKGDVNANKNSEPCTGCKGNGYFFGVNERAR